MTELVQAGPARADVSFNQQMLQLVNQQRSAAGIAPLQWSASLGSAAEDAPYNGCGFPVQGRAKDMGQRNYFSHTILGCPTQGAFDLLGALGVVSAASGENIGWMNGTSDYSLAAQRLMSDFMNSPPHRANILNPNYTHIGIGSWQTSPGQMWSGAGTPLANVWVTAQIFGRLPVTTAPALALNATSLAFGDRSVNTTSAAQSVTLSNQGNDALSVTGATIVGADAADFTLSGNGCGIVAPAGSCSINVAFAPRSAGAKAATLQINDNASGSPHLVSLAGNSTTPAPALPGITAAVQTTGGDAQIRVSWSPASTGGPVDGYSVYLWDANGYAGQNQSMCASCLTAGFAGVTNGRSYYVTVAGYNAAGSGNAGYSGWTTVAATPEAPIGFRVTPGSSQMTATWAPPATIGAAIDGYWIFVYGGSGYTGKWGWACATCTTASITGLVNGQWYYAAAYAHNGLGWGQLALSSWFPVG